MSTEEIKSGSEMRNKKEAAAKQGLVKRICSILGDGCFPCEESVEANVPKVAKSSVPQELAGEDRAQCWRKKSKELFEAAIGGFYLPDLLRGK